MWCIEGYQAGAQVAGIGCIDDDGQYQEQRTELNMTSLHNGVPLTVDRYCFRPAGNYLLV